MRTFRYAPRRETLARILSSLAIAVLLAATPGAASWQEEPQTPQQALESFDRKLAPVVGRLAATFEDLAYEGDDEIVGAFATVLQETAAKGYGITAATNPDRCWREYWAALHTGFQLLADGIDSFRAQAPETSAQIQSGWYLISPEGYSTLLRDATDCGGGTVTATPRPSASVQP